MINYTSEHTVDFKTWRRQSPSSGWEDFNWKSPDLPGDEDATAARWRSSHSLSWWKRKRGEDPSSGKRVWPLSSCALLYCRVPLHHLTTSCHPAHLLFYEWSSEEDPKPEEELWLDPDHGLCRHRRRGGRQNRTGPTNLQLYNLKTRVEGGLHPGLSRRDQGKGGDFPGDGAGGSRALTFWQSSWVSLASETTEYWSVKEAAESWLAEDAAES